METAQQATTTPQAHPQESQWDTGYGGGYSDHHEGSIYYPSHGYPESSLRAGTSAFARYPDWYTPLEQYANYGADQVERTVEGIG
jgi:rubredoxin